MNVNLVQVSIFGGSPIGGLISPEQWKRRYWQVIHRSKRIRFSISALIRIQIDDQYLLIRGSRVNKTKFQPVGGVLKYYPSATRDLELCGYGSDTLYKVDDENREDLRLTIAGGKLCQFLSWYESGLGREQSPWREFWEELVKPEIVPGKVFPHANLQFLHKHSSGIDWNDHIGAYECRIAEIYELIPNLEQRAFLETLKKSPHPDLMWADAETIRSRGIRPKLATEECISDTSSWLLPR